MFCDVSKLENILQIGFTHYKVTEDRSVSNRQYRQCNFGLQKLSQIDTTKSCDRQTEIATWLSVGQPFIFPKLIHWYSGLLFACFNLFLD